MTHKQQHSTIGTNQQSPTEQQAGNDSNQSIGNNSNQSIGKHSNQLISNIVTNPLVAIVTTVQ